MVLAVPSTTVDLVDLWGLPCFLQTKQQQQQQQMMPIVMKMAIINLWYMFPTQSTQHWCNLSLPCPPQLCSSTAFQPSINLTAYPIIITSNAHNLYIQWSRYIILSYHHNRFRLCTHISWYRIAQNFDGGNFDGYWLFKYLTENILTDGDCLSLYTCKC